MDIDKDSFLKDDETFLNEEDQFFIDFDKNHESKLQDELKPEIVYPFYGLKISDGLSLPETK